jgi:hypothetical protein
MSSIHFFVLKRQKNTSSFSWPLPILGLFLSRKMPSKSTPSNHGSFILQMKVSHPYPEKAKRSYSIINNLPITWGKLIPFPPFCLIVFFHKGQTANTEVGRYVAKANHFSLFFGSRIDVEKCR